MSIVTKNLSRYVESKKINLSAMARDTGLDYQAIYSSLRDKGRGRSLRDDELVAICKFLGVNPMDFAEKIEEG